MGKRSISKKRSSSSSPLTPAQAEILAYIRARCAGMEGSPSYREIQQHFGYRAVGTVQDHVRALKSKGLLEKYPPGPTKRRARGLMPAGLVLEGIKRVPIYGEISAGPMRESAQVELGALPI